MAEAIILLGSNIDKERNLPSAVARLRDVVDVTAVSPVFETLPVGRPEQPTFFNVAVLVNTSLEPGALKGGMLAPLEAALGRRRTDDKFAARTLDADIILYDDRVDEYDGRSLPDPDLLRHPHVAVPVAFLRPDLPHPVTGEPLGALADRLLAEATIMNEGRLPLWPRPDVRV